jgi:hypothetical protein
MDGDGGNAAAGVVLAVPLECTDMVCMVGRLLGAVLSSLNGGGEGGSTAGSREVAARAALAAWKMQQYLPWVNAHLMANLLLIGALLRRPGGAWGERPPGEMPAAAARMTTTTTTGPCCGRPWLSSAQTASRRLLNAP